MHHASRRAFTLVELLIVIVIIGLLTGLATTSYINAQKNARDNTRKSDVASIATSVETFYQAKRRFPGLIGNEGAGSIPQVNQRAVWAGCLALDTASGYSSVVYYSYPTTQGGTGDKQACNERTGSATGFTALHYGPYPNWIPELGEYLNPAPLEKRYQAANADSTRTLDDPGTGAFTAQLNDVLGDNLAQAFVYRRLVGGFMVYTRLENGTTDITVGTPMSDTPKYSNNVGVTVYRNNVFMIRK